MALGQVRTELEVLGEHFSATDDSILEAIFPEGFLTTRSDDKGMAAELVRNMSRGDFKDAVAAANFIERPHRNGERHADEVSTALAAFIVGTDCCTPEPVTVWRGEHPFEGSEHGSRQAMLNSPVGTVIQRPATALSATWSPAVAGRGEFCGSVNAQADEEPTGWVLEIYTRHVLDVSARDTVLERSDGLAADEQEVLIVAPRLRVDGRREAIVDGTHCSHRIVVVECTAV